MLRRFIIPILAMVTAILVSSGQLKAQCPRQSGSHQTAKTTMDLSSSPKITIETVQFEGQTGLNPIERAEIVEAIKGRVSNYAPGWPQEFEERLRDAWQELGYYKVQIEARAQEIRATQVEKVFRVTVNVESGRRYYLGDIHFLGGTQFSLPQMRSLFPIQAGDLFNSHKLSAGLEALRIAYGTRGFINSTFIPGVSYDEAHGLISLNVEIEEGLQFHVSNTYVIGMDPAAAKAALLNSGLEPGNVVDWEKADKFAERHQMELSKYIDDKRGLVCFEISPPTDQKDKHYPPSPN